MPDVRYLLWDFGDTLVDQTFCWPSPDGVPGWTDCFRTLVNGHTGERWELGELTTEAFGALMAAELGMTAAAVVAHFEVRCRDIRFFEHAWATASARTRPQAIVTLNPDVFSRVIVPFYELHSVFDVIVTSWEERTRPTRLCEIALERLGGDDPAEALLVDNIEANADAWRARGGQSYWFRGDAEFAASLPL